MIKEARKSNNLTQKELAFRCNLSQSYLSKLEMPLCKYKINPSLMQVIIIAGELNLNPYELSNWFISKLLKNNNKTEFSNEISFSSLINKTLGGDIYENCNLLT